MNVKCLFTNLHDCVCLERNFNSDGNYTVNFVPRGDRSYVQTFAFRNRSQGVNVIAEGGTCANKCYECASH